MIDLGAGLLEQRQRPRAHHLDAEIFENVQRGLVDRLDLVGRQQRHRRIGIAHPPQRQLRDCGRSPVAGPLGAAFASRFAHRAALASRAGSAAGCISASISGAMDGAAIDASSPCPLSAAPCRPGRRLASSRGICRCARARRAGCRRYPAPPRACDARRLPSASAISTSAQRSRRETALNSAGRRRGVSRLDRRNMSGSTERLALDLRRTDLASHQQGCNRETASCTALHRWCVVAA